MAFKMNDVIIDSIDTALATKFDGTPLYTLTQLTDATIDITGESQEATDKNGTLIKKVWKSKTGTFSATNAMINLSIIGAMSGRDGAVLAEDKTINVPKIITVQNKGVEGGANLTELTLDGYDVDTCTVQIAEETNSGAMGKVFAAGTDYTIGTDGKITFPATAEATGDDAVDKFVILYTRPVSANAMMIENRADDFPGTVRLYIKALAYDPCSADTLRAVMIYLPSFQVSPEVSISLSSDGTIDYSGDLQVDYCSADKVTK